MPIRWSTLKVSEAAGMIEGYVNQAAEPLEQARLVAQEARKIDNLPEYVKQYFNRLIGEIDRAIGGSQWEPVGRMKSALQAIRDSLPKEAVKAQKARAAYGDQKSLI